MTIVEPIPDLQWGKGNWQDYISNWRTRDTGWMQERLILRYQTTAARTTDWPVPKSGQVTYNDQSGLLEMWSQTKAAWLRSLMFQYLSSNKDDATGVNLSHASAGGKGVQLTPTSLLVDAPTTNFLNGLGIIDATGLAIKVGTKTAKLSTDAANLVIDSPIKAPSGVIDAITASGAISAGSISAAAATLTNIGMTGTLSGGIVNGSSGTIGGVALGTAAVGGSGILNAASGLQSQQGYFYGDSTSAFVRQRAANAGALGASYLQINAADIYSQGGGSHYMNTYLRIMGGRGVPWHNAAGTHVAWLAPVIYSGGDPGAGNYPDGTIWIS